MAGSPTILRTPSRNTAPAAASSYEPSEAATKAKITAIPGHFDPQRAATALVDILRNYSNSQGSEKPVLSLISDATKVKTPNGNRNKKSLQPRVRRLSDQEAEELVEAYREGDSVYALGRRFGIHRRTVSEHLKRAGVPTRSVKERTLSPEQVAKAVQLRQERMSLARIATAIGTTEYAVKRELGRL